MSLARHAQQLSEWAGGYQYTEMDVVIVHTTVSANAHERSTQTVCLLIKLVYINYDTSEHEPCGVLGQCDVEMENVLY